MLSVDRRKYILDQLKAHGSVRVDQLAEMLDVTQMTIRRDLDKLEDDVTVKRTHGGAVLYSHLHDEEAYDEKKEKNKEAKAAIAKIANEMIKPHKTVLLDAGTTTYELALLLRYRNDLVIVTGDLTIASVLYKSDNEVYFIGGKLERKTGTVMETEGNSILDNINVDYVFLGSSAVASDGYLSTTTLSKANIKKRIFKLAHKRILLVDKTKFGKEAFAKIVPIQDFDVVITNKEIEGELKRSLEEEGVIIKQVKED